MTIQLMDAALKEPTLQGEERLFLISVADANGEVSIRQAAKWCNVAPEKAEEIFRQMLCAGWFALVDGIYVQPQMYAAHYQDAFGHSRREKKFSFPPSTRRKIMERDGGKCHYCGSTENMTIDHKQPQCRGGSHADDNLVAACKRCNCSKGTKSYDEFMAYRVAL